MTKADISRRANQTKFLVRQIDDRDLIIFELRENIRALHKEKADLAELVRKTQADFEHYKKPRTDIEGFDIDGGRAQL